MNLITILAFITIYIVTIQSSPTHGKTTDSDDDRTCFMRQKNPRLLIRIPCDIEIDPISEIYHFINEKRFDGDPETGLKYLNNLADFLMDLKEAAQENDKQTFYPKMKSMDDKSGRDMGDSDDSKTESEETSQETTSAENKTETGRRTFSMVGPVVRIALKTLGEDFGFSTNSEVEVERQIQNEQVLSAFRTAQERAVLETLETKQQLVEMEARARESALKREEEMATLRTLVSSMKNSQERDQIEKNYRDLILQRDSKSLEREIDSLKRKIEIENLIQSKKREDFENKYEIERLIKENREIRDMSKDVKEISKEIKDVEIIQESSKTASLTADPKCEICG